MAQTTKEEDFYPLDYLHKLSEDNKTHRDIIRSYIDCGYEINEILRSSPNALNNCYDETHKKNIIKISKLLQENEIQLESNVCLFRGIPNPIMYMKQNMCIKDPAFMSTSMSFSIGEHFMRYDHNKTEVCCVIHIHLAQGNSYNMVVVPYGKNDLSYEREIIFPRDTLVTLIRDDDLLNKIASVMGYEIKENRKYDNLFECDERKSQVTIPFKVFVKEGTIILPMTIKGKTRSNNGSNNGSHKSSTTLNGSGLKPKPKPKNLIK